MKTNILIVDDDQLVLNALARSLGKEYNVLLSLNGASALQLLREQTVAVIVSDQRMPGMTGVDLLQAAYQIQPRAKRILLTGYSDRDATVAAINEGRIFHYVEKPWEPEELLHIIRRAVEQVALEEENERLKQSLAAANQRLKEENRLLQAEVKEHYSFDHIVGRSAAMQDVFRLMEKVIPSDITVFIEGETGTGKELVAKAIHYNGPRKEKIFAAQNCAAMPETLLESTLFGHRKGAFTDAREDRPGLFEMADGGTVFLDEVGEMTPAMQQRLLRVLQDGEIQPVGATKTKRVDVRIISATHVDLLQAVRRGTFREDLYFRLHVMPLRLPPLRERLEDVEDLVTFFLRRTALKTGRSIPKVSAGAWKKLKAYAWPGNIRELENMVARALILAGDADTLEAAHFLGLEEAANVPSPTDLTLKPALETLERRYISRALEETGGNLSQAAKRLGLSRMGLYKKLERLKL
ncbi:MAG: sigma-54-dependent transcriptional regulator [Fidelibacterota bacterium]